MKLTLTFNLSCETTLQLHGNYRAVFNALAGLKKKQREYQCALTQIMRKLFVP